MADEKKGARPCYLARAKQRPDSDYMMTIGSAWPFKSGGDGFVVKITMTPVGWDGQFILVPPREDEEGK